MKWILFTLCLFAFNAYSIQSIPAAAGDPGPNTVSYECGMYVNNSYSRYLTNSDFTKCSAAMGAAPVSVGPLKSTFNSGSYKVYEYQLLYNGNNWQLHTMRMYFTAAQLSKVCPPTGSPQYTVGPINIGGVLMCQTVPKTCLMGAAVRIDKDGKETCVANCSAAAGLSNGGAVYYNGGADNTISADDVTCFGQCAVSATTLVQNAAGYYSGPFTFTGANCSVVRPEPVTGSDTAGLNEDPTPVDNSNTSQGTQDSLDNLSNAASSSNSTEIDTPSTGANGESTIKDLQQTVKDSAIEQIKSNTSSASNLGNLLSNISNDLQNAIANSGGGGGNGNSSLQLQGNNKLDGINQTLQDISDKLDEPQEEEPPFTPPTSSPNFWENVLPDSSFNDIKSKTESAGQELKDMYEDFRSSIFVSDIAASGTAWADSFTKNGQTFELGSSWFEYAINHGFYAIVILLATMFAVYIVTSRGK